jgi:hypothetical protein
MIFFRIFLRALLLIREDTFRNFSKSSFSPFEPFTLVFVSIDLLALAYGLLELFPWYLSGAGSAFCEFSRRPLAVRRFRPSASSRGVGRPFRELCPSRIALIGSAIPLHR